MILPGIARRNRRRPCCSRWATRTPGELSVSQRQKFNLHLPGLLKVLAEHLYSSKKVGIRELIQNAHDSCVRRKIEAGEADYRPRIDVSLDIPKRTVVIRDNGNGLTAEEIETYLATIGRGYTRELRERLSLDSPAEAAELIGQFGLGFLSAFLLAGEVTLLDALPQGRPSPALVLRRRRALRSQRGRARSARHHRAAQDQTGRVVHPQRADPAGHHPHLRRFPADADLLRRRSRPGQPDGPAVGGRQPRRGHPRLRRPGLSRHQGPVRAALAGLEGHGRPRFHEGAPEGLPVRAAWLSSLGARVRRSAGVHPPHVHLRARARPAAALGPLCPRRHRVPALAADRLPREHPPGRELRVGAAGPGGAAGQRPARPGPQGPQHLEAGGARPQRRDHRLGGQRQRVLRAGRGHRHLPHQSGSAEPAGIPGPLRRQPVLRHPRAGLASRAAAGRGPGRAGH